MSPPLTSFGFPSEAQKTKVAQTVEKTEQKSIASEEPTVKETPKSKRLNIETNEIISINSHLGFRQLPANYVKEIWRSGTGYTIQVVPDPEGKYAHNVFEIDEESGLKILSLHKETDKKLPDVNKLIDFEWKKRDYQEKLKEFDRAKDELDKLKAEIENEGLIME